MQNTRLDEVQAGTTIAGRNINNLRYADDTTPMTESEELKSLLMKVKEESKKVGLKLNIQKKKAPTQTIQFSRSVVSYSLRAHESQHTRPPCPSPTLGVHSDSRQNRVSDAIQPSHPLSSPSPPAPNPSQHQSLFQ